MGANEASFEKNLHIFESFKKVIFLQIHSFSRIRYCQRIFVLIEGVEHTEWHHGHVHYEACTRYKERMRWVVQPRQPRVHYRDNAVEPFDSCKGPGAGVVLDRHQEGGGGGRNFVEDDHIAMTPDGPGRKGGNSR